MTGDERSDGDADREDIASGVRDKLADAGDGHQGERDQAARDRFSAAARRHERDDHGGDDAA